MAEIERARSTRWRRIAPLDAEAAERAWLRAEALDGGRVPGLGEVASAISSAGGDDRAHAAGRRPSVARWSARRGRGRDPRRSARAGRDGRRRAGLGGMDRSAGGCLDAAMSTHPRTKPCSVADTAYATLAEDVVHADHVRCARWTLATSGAQPGAIRIARCEADRCGPLVDWRAPPPWTRPRPPGAPGAGPGAASPEAHGSRWPAWATWALAGAGVAVAAGVGIVASGALGSAPTETRFVNGGTEDAVRQSTRASRLGRIADRGRGA